MTDSENKTHVDIFASIGGFQMFLGHKDIDGEQYSHKRFQEIASLLHEIAWQFEDEATKYENFIPRCFKNSLGDHFFEVAPDVFVDGDDRREAETLYLANTLTNTLDELKSYYPELEQVSE